jgi:hypothetical protein
VATIVPAGDATALLAGVAATAVNCGDVIAGLSGGIEMAGDIIGTSAFQAPDDGASTGVLDNGGDRTADPPATTPPPPPPPLEEPAAPSPPAAPVAVLSPDDPPPAAPL